MKYTRAQLAKFLPDNEAIRLIEELINTADKAYSSAGSPVPASGSASSTTLVSCASVSVESGATYRFEFDALYSAAGGTRWVVDGPAGSVGYTVQWSLSTTANSVSNANAYNLPAAANASSAYATGNVVRIAGFVNPTASGVLTVKFASGGAFATTITSGQLRLIRLT